MQYVLMIHASESRFATLPKEEVEAVLQEYGAFTKDLMGTGRAGDCAALDATHTATRVQIRDGKRVVQDGPFAETREQLGGYYSIDAKDEEEALAWAAKIPDAEGGTIEVRPIKVTGAPSAPAAAPDDKGKKEYLFLIYEAEARWASLSQAEATAIFARYMDFSKGLKQNGHFVAGEQLDTVKKAKCVSVKSGERVVRDGPFAETREQLGGYYRVVARDLDEAIALAAKIPAAETGVVEIRPIMDTSAYA